MSLREKAAIIGPIDDIGKKTIHEGLDCDFDVIEIASKEEYQKLADCSYAILRTLKLNGEDIQKAPKLKLIQRWGVGYDSVDIQTAAANGIQVAVTAGINAVPVAEYTILLMLSVYRNLLQIDRNVRIGKWKDDGLIARSYLIQEKTVGLIGMGSIGREVAKRVQAFGADVVYYDAIRLSEEREQQLHVRYLPMQELFRQADIISVHVPLLESTRNLINKERLCLMKKTAIVINTSRGGIINEADLYWALSSGTILGAGLDVFAQEPVEKDNPLLTLQQVTVSAHCAGNTIDNSVQMARRCVENIRRVSGGGRISEPDLVNGQLLRGESI